MPKPELPTLTSAQFTINVAKMTVMWSATSFSGHLFNFMNKYLEGSIYTNNYVEGIAGIIAMLCGAQIFSRLGLKWTFMLSYSMAIAAAFTVYLLESNMSEIVPEWYIMTFATGSNTQARMHKKAVERALYYLVPKVTFIAKLGVGLASVSTYQASFSRDDIFPADRRATAIGYC